MADEEVKAKDAQLLKPLADEVRSIDDTRPTGEWTVNIAHYYGFMYAEWTVATTSNRLVFPRKRSRETMRATENHIMPIIDRTVAVFMQQIASVPKVVPAANQSLAERNNIETSDALVQHLAEKPQLDDQGNWELFLRWLLLTGIAADFEYWDARAGKWFQTTVGQMYAEGKHAREILLSFDIYPDLHLADPAKAKRFTFRRLSDVDEIKKLYGKNVPAGAQMSEQMALTWQLSHLGDVMPPLPESKRAKYVFITLERPSEDYPDGRELHYTLAKNKPETLLYNDINHNPGGELQVAILQYRPMALGWSTNLGSQVRKNNLSTNGLLSAYIGIVRSATKQVWAVPESSGVSDRTLTDIQRNLVSIVRYNDDQSPTPPTLMPHTGVPTAALSGVLNELRQGREDLAHQHPTMKGQTQGQIRSRPAVQEVRETDLLPIQPLIDRMKRLVCEVAGWRASLGRQYFSERRIADVMVGPNRWKTYDFHRSNFSHKPRFYLPAQPNMPFSLEGKLDVIAKAQAIGYPQERVNALFSDVFQGARVGAIASMELRHREAQRWELEKLLRGEPVGVNVWDDDGYHKDEVDRFRNEDPEGYERIPDLVKAQIQDHWLAHAEQEIQKGLEMADRERVMAEAAGQVPGKGEGAPGGEAPGGPPAEEPAIVGVE